MSIAIKSCLKNSINFMMEKLSGGIFLIGIPSKLLMEKDKKLTTISSKKFNPYPMNQNKPSTTGKEITTSNSSVMPTLTKGSKKQSINSQAHKKSKFKKNPTTANNNHLFLKTSQLLNPIVSKSRSKSSSQLTITI